MESKERWLRAYVAQQLGEIWGNPAVAADGDGDWPFRSDWAACWVRTETCCDPWIVSVFAHAAVEVPRTQKVLREVHELNANARFVKVVWADGLVVVRGVALADGLDRRGLEHLLDSVTAVADDIGPMIATVHGGHTPVRPEEVGRET